MSVIQTIRNRYGKIAGAIIAIALIGFIVSDARNGTFGSFFGGHDQSIMKIDGKKIDAKEYQQRLKEYEMLVSMNGRNLDDVTRAQLDEQVLQDFVYETAVEEQCEKLGIQTTEEEKKALIYGENASPMVQRFQIRGQQVFINQQTNAFDPQIVKFLEKKLAEDPQSIDPTGTEKVQEKWEAVKSYVFRMNNVNKFNMLITGSVYVPLYEAKSAVTDENSRAAIRYVKVPFTTVNDNEVKVTDDDIKDYMKKHAKLYQSEDETRSIQYIAFDIIPSSADSARQLSALEEVRNDFSTTKDNKTFVNNKSDDASSYTDAYFNKRTFTSKYADTIMDMPVGSLYGPYYEGGSFKLTKLVDRKTLPDSVKCRQILVRTKDHDKEVASDSVALAKMDSAMTELKNGVSFDSVAAKYSEDDGSNKKVGEYIFTLLQRPTISKEFADFIFEGATGEKKRVKVSNDNYSGYHYIEILEQKGTGKSVQLATISKILAPSDSTVNAIYGKANEFAGKNTNAADFDASAKKMNYDERQGNSVKVNNFSIPGLGPAREVIRWMYDSKQKVGDVSPVFQLGEARYIVAKLSAIDSKGLPQITATNRQLLAQKVLEEKKADVLKKKFAGAASLDAIAQGSGQTVQSADSVMLGGGFIAGLGYEPQVIGAAFNHSLQPNTVSAGISGQGGVFFITVMSRIDNAIEASLLNAIAPQKQRNQEYQLRNAINQQIQQVVNQSAHVTYNASNF